MKKRIWSALTSLFLLTLVILALIFVPFDASSDVEGIAAEGSLNQGSSFDPDPTTQETFSLNGDFPESPLTNDQLPIIA